MWEGCTTAHRTRVRHMRHARLEAGRVRHKFASYVGRLLYSTGRGRFSCLFVQRLRGIDKDKI